MIIISYIYIYTYIYTYIYIYIYITPVYLDVSMMDAGTGK